jgi:hypothetical protein
MRSLCTGGVLAVAFFSLTSCGAPQPTQVVVTTPPPSAPLTVVPATPPQAQVEMIPPSPGGGAVWQPGHWRWTGIAGSDWQWVSGQYVIPPATASRWVPGQWMQQAGGGWIWVDGHWG